MEIPSYAVIIFIVEALQSNIHLYPMFCSIVKLYYSCISNYNNKNTFLTKEKCV